MDTLSLIDYNDVVMTQMAWDFLRLERLFLKQGHLLQE